MEYKYICVGNCPELDCCDEPHCKTDDPKAAFKDYPDGCPCGNIPDWKEISALGKRRKDAG